MIQGQEEGIGICLLLSVLTLPLKCIMLFESGLGLAINVYCKL